jgi:hypothetical protein
MWMNPTLIFSTLEGKCLCNLQKYQYKEPLEDLGVPGMIIKEFWQHDDKEYMDFEYRKPLVPKQIQKIAMGHEEISRVVLSCMCLWIEFY